MADHLSEQDVRDIATYTRIGLSDEQVAQMTEDLNAIIETLEPITRYDLTGVEPTYHPVASLCNVMRDDVAQSSFTQAEALMNAPTSQNGAFLIPSILGGGDE